MPKFPPNFVLCLALALLLAVSGNGFAQTYQIVASLPGGTGEKNAATGLIQASSGTFYGTTTLGGTSSNGTFFSYLSGLLSPLASFNATASGSSPNGLIVGADGSFYGTTSAGGSHSAGIAYKITTGGVITVLHTFMDGSVANDGSGPQGSLVLGPDGNYYGTTTSGGVGNNGTVFQMTPAGVVTILHRFEDGTANPDGAGPVAGLILGSDGYYYGTTPFGTGGSGTVFRITSVGKLFVVHSFMDGTVANDGKMPLAGLIQASDGNFYGTTASGGTNFNGALFKMTSSGITTILHSFGVSSVLPNDGIGPAAALLQAADGNFYGTTRLGGGTGNGIIFEMTPQGTYTILHQFAGGGDGATCTAALVQGADGSLYGTTTAGGGTNNAGIIFKLTPPASAPQITSAASTTFYAESTNSFTFKASGFPAPTFFASGLPGWASLNSTTGVLSGSTAGSTTTFTIFATNGSGPSASQSFTLNVAGPAAPVITNGPPPTMVPMGAAYNFAYQATGSPPITFAQVSGQLPPGITLSSTGVLSGAPTASGIFNATVSASGFGQSTPQNFSIQVIPALAPSFSVNAPSSTIVVNTPYSFNYSANGAPAPSFAVAYGSLPPGLTLTSAGQLSGTPTTVGTNTGTVIASNGVDPSAFQSFSFSVVTPSAPTITNGPTATQGVIGAFFTFTYQASGHPASTFSYTGNFPPGLTFTSTGVLSGRFTQIGTYFATITASNGTAPDATKNFTFTVVPSPVSGMTALGTFIPADGFGVNDLTQGTDANFYIAAEIGGSAQDGTVFEMTPAGQESIVHTFTGQTSGNDGKEPFGITLGSDGAFYGITFAGGANNLGSVYKIAQGVTTILHSFAGGAADGSTPQARLIQGTGTDHSFYGTTQLGGANNLGTLYKIDSSGNFTLLHSFGDPTVTNDGTRPEAPLVQDSAGNFYGTTLTGGNATNFGVVFKWTPQGIVILHAFGDTNVTSDGWQPTAPLVQGIDGNFYGTTKTGGSAGQGTIFKITPAGAITILHSFGDGSVLNDGNNQAGFAYLVLGADGNFYGTVGLGGSANEGVLYQLTPQGGMLVVRSFNDGSPINSDGDAPTGLILSADGNFYGMTGSGPIGTQGTLYKFSIQTVPSITNSIPPPPAMTGSAYSYTFTAAGFPIPTFILRSGNFPPGLTFSSTGVLSGSPTKAGTYSGTVTATNSNGTSLQSFSITITAAPTFSDTPTMPQWALAILMVLLMAVASRSIQPQRGEPS